MRLKRFGITTALAAVFTTVAVAQTVDQLPTATFPLSGGEFLLLSQSNPASPTGFSSRKATVSQVVSAVAPALANPTSQIGLTTVNGVAATAMRSDGAPSLSQSIAPTWTGLHNFTGGLQISGTSFPNFPNNTTTFLRGDGTFSAPTGASTNSQLFTSSGTWTKPGGVTVVYAYACGSGGGGGGGAQTPSGTAASGGGGGGAGSCAAQMFQASDVGSTASVTVGAAGTAGAGATTTNTAGGNGGNGGNSQFVNSSGGSANLKIIGYGGGGGQGGQVNATSAGGGSAGLLGAGNGTIGGRSGGISGVAGSFTASTIPFVGSNGGGGSTSTFITPASGDTVNGAVGGGPGGFITTTPSAINGGTPGASPYGGQCVNASGGGVGSNGTTDNSSLANQPGCGGGGGGSQLGQTGAPGTGAAGTQGGGGGGGGSVCSSGGSCTARNGGAGGAGGTGFVWVVAW